MTKDFKSPFIGEWVILRAYASGVHFGQLLQLSGQHAIIKKARRIWKWKAKKGIALSGLAQTGFDADYDNRLDAELPLHEITDVIEVIPCSPDMVKQIRSMEEYRS